MSDLMHFTISTSGITLFLLLTVLLFALLRWLRWLVGLVPMSKGRQRAVHRGILVSETVVVLVFLLTTIPMVFEDHPAYTPIFFIVLIGGIGWVSGFVIRDAVAGLFIKAGEIVRVGDSVRLEGATGTITRMGYRVLELETAEGLQVLVPYSRLSQQSVTRAAQADNAARHSFRVTGIAARDPQAPDRIRRAALVHHWCSLGRDPRVELEGDGLLVTVFALDAAYGPAIEDHVRALLRGPSSEGDVTRA